MTRERAAHVACTRAASNLTWQVAANDIRSATHCAVLDAVRGTDVTGPAWIAMDGLDDDTAWHGTHDVAAAVRP